MKGTDVTIDPVSTNFAPSGEDSPLKPRTDGLGRDAFLRLLVTQMQHQDPLQPQANGEFLAQLAQFSSLESLQSIKADIEALRGLVEVGVAGNSAQSTGGL
jgi:flagellar basal-body rod modification protein FlgD